MKDKPVLLIRADASKEIGHGHVMRCLALAQEWQKRGGTANIASSELSTSLVDRLSKEHIDIYELVGGEDDLKTAALATFLGADWLVIDGYQFDAGYQSVVVKRTYHGTKTLTINDGHSTLAQVDIALNQNSWAKPVEDRGLWAPYKWLLGSKYALLRQEFLHMLICTGSREAVNVFIGTGGTDNANMHERISNVVTSTGLKPCENIQIADIAISAGGSTCWELAYLGIPSILFTTANNQRKTVEDLSNRGVAISLGSVEHLANWQIENALISLAADKDRRMQMSKLGKELIDGHGAERVVTEMLK